MNRAPFPYFGGKYRLLPYLTNYVPRSIKCYLEPFFGSGTLLFSAASWANQEIINDLNGDVYNFFWVLRDQYPKLKQKITYTPYDVQTFNQARTIIKNKAETNPVRRAWAFYVLMQMSIMANRRNFSRGSGGDTKPQEFKRAKELLDYCAARIADAVIENEDALKVCKRYDDPQTFIYLDPPYLNVRRLSSMKPAYQNTVPTDQDHIDLLTWARTAKSYILISNYHNPVYDEMLKDWNMEEVQTLTMNAPGARGKKARPQKTTEVLWSNERCYEAKIKQPSLFEFFV